MKRFLLTLALLPALLHAQQIVNLGTGPNTGTGDPARTAFSKINDNATASWAWAPTCTAPLTCAGPFSSNPTFAWAATFATITGLWSGTCNASTFLRGDGACIAPSGTGTVTSVALTMPTGFTVGGSPITGAGTLAVTTSLSGPLKGTGSGIAPAAAADIVGLFSTCSGVQYLGADGACHAAGGGGGTPGGATNTVQYNNAGAFGGIPLGSDHQVLTSNGGSLPATFQDLPASGTVTSVAQTVPAPFTVSGSPVTTSGTLALSYASQTANTFLAAPNGSAGTPTMRAIVSADLPAAATACNWVLASQTLTLGTQALPCTLTPLANSANGAALTLRAGASNSSGNGGTLTLAGGAAFGTNKAGGTVALTGGAPTGSGTPGAVSLTSGTDNLTLNGSGDIHLSVSTDALVGFTVSNSATGTSTAAQMEAQNSEDDSVEFGMTDPMYSSLVSPNINGADGLFAWVATFSQAPFYFASGFDGSGLATPFAWADQNQNYLQDRLIANTTTDTNGFFYLGAAAGVPTGVPANITGAYAHSVPLRYDSTDNRLYAYNGAWRNLSTGGTVTSVGLTLPSVFTVSGSPVTGTGTLAASFATGQTANQVLASPNGSTGAVGLRSLVVADLPTGIPNANLSNSAFTLNGTSVSLGGTRTLSLASADFANQGTTTTVLHGNAAGNPSFAAVSLSADVTGTLADGSLSANVALLSASNSFTGTTQQISTAEPRLKFNETDQSTDLKLWDWDLQAGVFCLRTRTDADAAGVNAECFTRGTTTALASIMFGNATNNPAYQFLGTGTVTLGGGLSTNSVINGGRFQATASSVASNGIYLPAANSLGFSSNTTNRLTIDATGAWLIGATAGTAGQVLTSNGAGTPPTWSNGATGSFTGTLTGMASATTTTCNYSISSGVVVLTCNAGTSITGTSNATSFTLTGLPAAITPSVSRNGPITRMFDNSANTTGLAIVSGTTVTFWISTVSGTSLTVSNSGWTASGSKGLVSGWYFEYPL